MWFFVWEDLDGLGFTLLPEYEERPYYTRLWKSFKADSWEEAIKIYDKLMDELDGI